ncbi:MAG TPA: RICIN domain-containing protein [Kofleriaceae bacterium]|nr:RICIN domain-containing protein [Kofleriaceae bacterium]
MTGGGSGGDAGPGDGQGDAGAGGDEGPISTPVMPILEEDGFYPRAIELADGTVIAAIVAPQPSGRLGGTILESLDGGVTFETVGRIDGDLSLGGLCCATIYQLPHALGALPAGALLWSASVGGDDQGAAMSIPVFASTDVGRTWTYLSTVVTAGVPRSQGGLWEPEFSQLDDGSLVCHYSDETDPAHSQKLVARRSTDGVSWPEQRDIVSMAPSGARPGMPVVRRGDGGVFALSFEICGTDGCAAHLRFSNDGWSWGNAGDAGLRPHTLDGKHFRHAPTMTWIPQPGAGRYYMIGQMLYDGGGGVTGGNGSVILASSEGGAGNWYEIAAPVPVPEAYDNFCPNYSSTVLPLEGGRVALEVASKWDGARCRSYYARGPLRGTDDAAGLTDGASYVLRALNSGFCVDVENGSTAAGAEIRQWDCNGSAAQHFRIEAQGHGRWLLVNDGSGLCASAVSAAGPGVDVRQEACDGATTTRWLIENVGMGYYRVRDAEGAVCLDVAGGSADMGANIQQWTCNDLAPQIFRFDN